MPAKNLPPLSTNELIARAEDFTRREPAKAMLAGFGLGLALHVLPLRAIFSLLAGILSLLLRPALLLLGVLKLAELSRDRPRS